jgi:hypothetical protein
MRTSGALAPDVFDLYQAEQTCWRMTRTAFKQWSVGSDLPEDSGFGSEGAWPARQPAGENELRGE